MVDILIADDHEVVRSGYRRVFELGGEHKVIGEADCGQQAISLFKRIKPCLLVLDVMMPGPSIVDTLQRVVSYEPKARVLVVSMHDSLSLVERCFKAGALGYVTKSSEAYVLLEGVVKVAAGKRFISPDVAEKMALKQLNVKGNSAVSVLTPREFDVFIRLARGQAIANIANEMNISNKTIYNYTSKIKRQLAVSTTAELVHLALQESLLDWSEVS